MCNRPSLCSDTLIWGTPSKPSGWGKSVLNKNICNDNTRFAIFTGITIFHHHLVKRLLLRTLVHLLSGKLWSTCAVGKCVSDVLRNSGNNKALALSHERELNPPGWRFGTKLCKQQHRCKKTPLMDGFICYLLIFRNWRWSWADKQNTWSESTQYNIRDAK